MIEAAKGKDMDTIRSTQHVQDGQVHVAVPAEWANEEVEIFVTRKSAIVSIQAPKDKAAQMAALERFIGSGKPKPGEPSMLDQLIAERRESL